MRKSADIIRCVGLLFALVTAITSTPLAAKRGEILTSMNDRQYTFVRSWLLAHGYVPKAVRTRDTPDENCPGLLSCSAYPELVYCSGTGLSICESVFYKIIGRRFIKVFTYGERVKLVDGIYFATDADLREWGFDLRRTSPR